MRVGNSLCIVLPKPWLEYYDADIGDKVEIITKGRTATLTIIPNEKNQDYDESDKKHGYKN